jgi:hypothetical protein
MIQRFNDSKIQQFENLAYAELKVDDLKI